jgi:hypothetical protein
LAAMIAITIASDELRVFLDGLQLWFDNRF